MNPLASAVGVWQYLIHTITNTLRLRLKKKSTNSRSKVHEAVSLLQYSTVILHHNFLVEIDTE